ncbi:MAG: hypothetical protein AB1716_08460 [Planctomycetota bacterium]
MKAQCALLYIAAAVAGVGLAPGQMADVAMAVGGTRGAPDAGEECPPGALCGQDRVGGMLWFYSDAQLCSGGYCGRMRAEKYPPPGVTINKPIGGVTWYGVYLDGNANGCEKPRHLFHVRFYRDNGHNMPDPNQVVYSETLEAEARDTGERIVFQGGTREAVIWQFSAVLSGPVVLFSGWFSVQGDSDPPIPCYHLWAPSNEGDGLIVQWWEQPFGGFQYATLTVDLNYCLLEARVGACCNDCTSQCQNDVLELFCLREGGRFAQNTLCAIMTPRCGDAPGACCHDDGTCTITRCTECVIAGARCRGDCNCDGRVDFDDINPFVTALTSMWLWQMLYPGCPVANPDLNRDGVVDFEDINVFVECLSAGGGSCFSGPWGPCEPGQWGSVWIGPGTTCEQCCTVVVPHGALRENEPYCYPGYVDTFNGGCNSSPPVFSELACGQTVYGRSGTFTAGNPPAPVRDTDWYRFTIAENSILSLEVTAEFDVLVWLAHGGACDPNTGYWELDRAVTGAKCTPTTFTSRCMLPGEYWAVVMPQALSGVPCGADYKLTLTCVPSCTPCAVDCPPGALQESEACGANTNGGPNATPNVFEPILVNTQYCGTIWARNGRADEDWYEFQLTRLSACEIYWEAEFPARPGFKTCQETAVFGARCTCLHWGVQVAPCTPARVGGFTLPPGGYWFTPFIQDDVGRIFYGYPCGTQNHYTFRISAEEINCPGLVICSGAPPPEGEAECGPNYIDTFNGGCDAALRRFLPITCDQPGGGVCAASGTFTRNDPNHPFGMDTDWFELPVTQDTKVVLQIWTELPLSLRVLRGPTCPGELLEEYEFHACQRAPDVHTQCLTPGTYWFRFAPTHAGLGIPCDWNYVFLVDCQPCSPDAGLSPPAPGG